MCRALSPIQAASLLERRYPLALPPYKVAHVHSVAGPFLQGEGSAISHFFSELVQLNLLNLACWFIRFLYQ